MEFLNDTICALSTPQGAGAIAVIRISGKEALQVIEKIFTPVGGKQALPYLMRYGSVKDGGRLIDECLVATFNAPHSYTGENSAEIYCHGSSYIVKEILELLVSCGVKMAEPGEFSKRAFLNGKLDLAQAEAVMDLISSETSAAHKVALQQMKGGFSNELKVMREALLNLVSMMELELDFSEEDVEFADRSELSRLLEEVSGKIAKLIESFKLGNVIKNGVPVAIIGATNTGKSTLLNTLLGEERAIVSNIHGTTRDVIEDTVNLGGITFRFIDTAGIRETKETIEIIGIERTYKKLQQASIVIMVLDATRPEYFDSSLKNLSSRLNPEQQLIILINKADKFSSCIPTDPGMESDPEPINNAIDSSNSEPAADSEAPASTCSSNTSYEGGQNSVNMSIEQLIEEARNICKGNNSDTLSVENEAKNSFTASKIATTNTSLFSPMEEDAENNGAKQKAPLLQPLAVLPISAKLGQGIEALKELLINTQNQRAAIESNATLVTNVRHYQALADAQLALDRVEDGLQAQIPTDLVAQDIREALYHLGSIVGEINTEEVLGNIFSRFCIGK